MLLATLLLLSSFALPHAQAAGESQLSAISVTDGSYSGTGTGRDVWYVLSVPAGKAAFAQYQTAGGYGSAYLYDSSGGQITYVYNGAAYMPEDGQAFVRLYASSGGTYTLTLSFINVAPQNDAGSGRDAGRDFAHAAVASPGFVSGNTPTASGDPGDAIRLDSAPGMIVDVTGYNGPRAQVVRADGLVLGSLYGCCGGNPSWSGVSDGQPIYVAVGPGDVYSFRFATSWPADLALTGLAVRDVPVMAGDAAAPAGTQREVSFHVANHGAGATRLGRLTVLATHEGVTSSRVVADRDLSLAAGEEADITLAWDTTGEAGNFTLVASVSSQYENQTSDDAQSATTSVLVGGLPVGGFDLLNVQARASTYAAGIEYGGERIGVDTPQGFAGSDHGTLVLLA